MFLLVWQMQQILLLSLVQKLSCQAALNAFTIIIIEPKISFIYFVVWETNNDT